jgi:squalene-hopene/tetraprenyl-beta-curcumene cyclase
MEKFNFYIQNLPISDTFKSVILDSNFINGNPAFYQNYPSLFSNAFSITKEHLDLLDISGYLYYQATIFTDSLIDKKDISKFPLISICQEESIKILTSIYGLESDFWELWNKRRNEYLDAIVFEKGLSKKEVVTIEEYETLADAKSAFGKVAIDCLYSLDNTNKAVYEKLLLSHKCFSVGFQLYDDVKDFKEDFIDNQFNWAIYELKKNIDFEDFPNNYETLNKLLYIKGIGQNILSLSIKYFQKSIDLISSLKKDSEWLKINTEMKETIEIYLEVTNGYIRTISKKIEIGKSKNLNLKFFDFASIDNCNIRLGLEYIKEDFDKNYSELIHYMYFSKNRGFEKGDAIHYSDTFQRAMLNDCLLTVKEKYNINTFDFFDLECNYLIEKSNKDVIGAWSYFPTVQEIAADIDDLGQIMQLFINRNRFDLIEKHCLTAINVALTDRTCKNGGIETWIIPRENQNEIQTKQEYFNTTKWGCGPDLEVVANFVFALQKYNPITYKENITNVIPYIISCQSKEGFWESRWYYGSFYGTYVCLRLLKEFENEYSTSINLALKYVLKSQNEDGGFGLMKFSKSDALSTSFALLVLKMYAKNNREPIVKAEEYLIKTQDKLGYWNEIDFIKPRQQEPYKSKTLTTAFVLKALC